MTNTRATNDPIVDGMGQELMGAPNNVCYISEEPKYRSIFERLCAEQFRQDMPAKKPRKLRKSNFPEQRAKPAKDPRLDAVVRELRESIESEMPSSDPDERVFW